jgi:cell division protein FtsZ
MLAFEEKKKSPAMIKVVGVGGGGMNAIERMVSMNLEGVELIAMNTDEQVLERSHAPIKVALGAKLTRGMGAGGIPDVGAQAAMEDREKIMNVLKGADMVFITAGMGGGTGTGAAPIVAEVARELKALTVGVVTLPFIVEGDKRMNYAKQGQNNLRERVDTLITIPNEAIFKVIDKKTSVGAAYKLIDDMLYRAVRGISNIINSTGFVNVDFADVRTVMGQNGDAVIGLGEGTGENRVVEALQSAIHHPLLNGKTIDGAQAVLINVVGGSDFALYEYHEIQKQIHEQVSKEAVIIVGFTEDETKDNHVSITVIATGYRRKESVDLKPPQAQQPQFKPQILPRTGTEDGGFRSGTSQQGLDFPRVDTSVQAATYDIPTFLRKMPKVE